VSAAPVISLVPKRHSLVEYLDDIETIQTTLESLDDEQLEDGAREDLERMMVEAIAGTRAKVDRTAGILTAFETAAAAAKAEAARQAARMKYFERSVARIESYVLATLSASGLKKLDGTISTLAARNNPPSVVIDDVDAIPADFMRSPAIPADVPDKAAIKRVLAAGDLVPGAHLEVAVRLVRS
jgi:hypothetical protein